MSRRTSVGAVGVAAVVLATSRGDPPPELDIRLVIAGQALIKKDPRIRWGDAFGTIRPILDGADIAFTNFEMAVASEPDRCGLPSDYEVSLGTPEMPRDERPGYSGGPHAVTPDVMDFLSSLGFNRVLAAGSGRR